MKKFLIAVLAIVIVIVYSAICWFVGVCILGNYKIDDPIIMFFARIFLGQFIVALYLAFFKMVLDLVFPKRFTKNIKN